MSKMKTAFGKGRKPRRALLVALVMAVLLSATGITASAGWFDDWWGGGGSSNTGKQKFVPNVAGVSGVQDGSMSFALGTPISLANGVFSVEASNFSSVKAIVITTEGIGASSSSTRSTALWASLNESSINGWSTTDRIEDDDNVRWVYKPSGSFTYSMFNTAMGRITVGFDTSFAATSGSGKVSVTAYKNASATDAIKASAYSNDQKKYVNASTYTCKLLFYDYAKGAIDANSAVMDYKTEYAASYDSSYASDVPDGVVTTGLKVSPSNTGGGKASFNLYITQGGGTLEPGEPTPEYGYKAQVGYQIKLSSQSWTSTAGRVVHWLSDVGHSNVAPNGVIPLYEWDKSWAIPVTIEGLNASSSTSTVSYDVRGVIATDGKTNAPEYTDPVTFQYSPPNISSLNIGSTSQVYTDEMYMPRLSMAATYNDRNAIGRTYTSVDGNTYTGPALQAALYFTPDRARESGQDRAKWYRIGSTVTTQVMTDADGNLLDTFTKEWTNFKIPASLSEYTGGTSAEETKRIDSANCAFKLVVTDLFTGYTTVTYSDPFTIDSSAPSGLTVTATDKNGNPMSLALTSNPAVVGGSGAQVKINIGGAAASEATGSGVRDYSYAVFYWPTEKAQGATTYDVLVNMKNMTAASAKNAGADYTDWASAPYVTQNGNTLDVAQFTVAKDGYYRILARATDNAGHSSEIEEAYFRVDLSMPTKPVVRLVQADGSTFKPYDNRTYTTATVWLFAYSTPLTGKTLDKFEYSADGGLTWNDMTGAAANGVTFTTANRKLALTAATPPTVRAYAEGQYSVEENFKYQIGINLSALGYDDYNAFLVRATDSLTNTSLASEAVVMRTTPSGVTGSATMSHDPIEVALAIGNIDGFDTDPVTADLKNAAAKKINEKFYGTAGSKTIGAADFNPYLYTKDHNCSWGSDASCSGDCKTSTNAINTSCPYYILEHATDASGQLYNYALYKPAEVNVQGMSNGDASVGMTWYHYDHSDSGADQSKLSTLGALKPTGDPLKYRGELKSGSTTEYLYTAADNYVQNSNFNGSYAQNGTWGKNSENDKTAVGYFDKVVKNRVYHMVPMGHLVDANGNTTLTETGVNSVTGTHNINYEGQSNFAIDVVKTYGYSTKTLRDWMFMYNDNPAKKSIAFTIDDAQVLAHSNDGYGFLWNTTQRQNKSGTWVVSGYMFYIFNYTNPGKAGTAYNWMLVKLTDVNLTNMANATLSSQNLGYHIAANNKDGFTNLKNWSSGLYGSTAVRHFRLQCSGSTTKIYCWQEGSKSTLTPAQLETRFNTDTNNGKTDGASSYTAGFKAIDFGSSLCVSGSTTELNTPRPTVDGETIGAVGGSNVYHKDTNCYGFGLIVGANDVSHTCQQDTQIVFSNIIMKVTNVRKLSEVVTEPSWGNGKAKFIANLSDDGVTDFKDPVLTSQIQWRLNNDQARYIGWGKTSNKQETVDFLQRMASTSAAFGSPELEKIGTFVETNGSAAYAKQVDTVATYITNQYYVEFGFDPYSSTKIADQLSPTDGLKRGTVYSINDVDNINLKVTPEKYNSASANPDFPSGRWYMVHDTNGYRNAGNKAEIDPRNGGYSDALEANITYAGRYTYYFAPDKTAIANGTLNPDTAVFDFVVNQAPVAMFSATINKSTGKLVIQDDSYDPDWGNWPLRDTSHPVPKVNGVQLTGIKKTEWRYEMLTKNGDNLSVVKSTAWQATSPSGKTPYELSGNNTAFASGMPDNGVLTVYCRVTDTSTRRVWNSATNSYQYEEIAGGGVTSAVAQVNVSANATIMNPPSAAISMSSPYIYDTAKDKPNTVDNDGNVVDNKKITITRNSTHSQDKEFAVSWKIGVGSPSADKYISLTRSGTDLTKKTSWDYYGNVTYTNASGSSVTQNMKILTCETLPKNISGTTIGNIDRASTGGEWSISWDTIDKLLGANYKDSGNQGLVIQVTESAWGISAENAANGRTADSYKGAVSDSSARTLYYKTDRYSPAPPVVMTSTLNNGKEESYNASQYLDVTNNDKFVQVKISGSEDTEGKVKAYGYYFYETNTAGVENAWYSMDNVNGGALTQRASAKDALRSINYTDKDTVVTLRFGKAAMRKSPTDSLNLAVFAYDTQTSMTGSGNITGANETSKTRIEDIKLSTSKPMPPEITVTDNLNQQVAYISNANGYDGSTGTDTAISTPASLNFFSASAVTVKFQPKTARYSTVNGELVKSAGGTEYYEDTSGNADLTGIAQILYTVKYKESSSESWWTDTQYRNAGMSAMPVDQTMEAAHSLSYARDGIYEITAKVVNGSGTVSAARTVTFTVDTTPPSSLNVTYLDGDSNPYISGAWARKVTVAVNNAEDVNRDVYQYSVDGGRSFTELGKIDGSDHYLNIPSGTIPSGQYTVIIRAKDLAGNVTDSKAMTVRVDDTPPETPAATLIADSVSREIYDEYILHLNYSSSAGKIVVTRNEDGNQVYTNVHDNGAMDTEVYVPANGSAFLSFEPASGKQLASILVDGEEIGLDDDSWSGVNKDVYEMTMSGIYADHEITAVFVDKGVSVNSFSLLNTGINFARAASAMRAAPVITYNSLKDDFESQGEETQQGQTGDYIVGAVVEGSLSASVDYESQFAATGWLAPKDWIAWFDITPGPKMEVDTITVNGSTVVLTEGENWFNQGNGVYRFLSEPITQNTSVVITVKKQVLRTVTVSSADPASGTVTLTAIDGESSIGAYQKAGGGYEVPVGAQLQMTLQSGDAKATDGASMGYLYQPSKLLVNGVAEDSALFPETATPGTFTLTYTVPAPANPDDADLSLRVEWGIRTGTISQKIPTTVTGPGTVTPGLVDGNVEVPIMNDAGNPAGGMRALTLTPEAGYRVGGVYVTRVDADENIETREPAPLTPGEGRAQVVQVDAFMSRLEVNFVRQTYAVTVQSSSGGRVSVTADTTESYTLNAVPEGAELDISITPNSGYRVRSVQVIHNGSAFDPGTVTKYHLNNGLSGPVQISVTFEARTISTTETFHTITARAENVKDAGADLDDMPYSFSIQKGTVEDGDIDVSNANSWHWSDWSASYTKTFELYTHDDHVTTERLDPNAVYTIFVRTRDKVHNQSEAVPAAIYTHVNTPSVDGVESVDEKGNSLSKSVRITVNTNGNPEDTEYLVYYSTSSNMEDAQVANYYLDANQTQLNPSEGWATLSGDKFIVNNLTAGVRYYFQVIARNHVADGSGATAVLSSVTGDIVNIILSPAAPKKGSIYYDEPASPVGDIVLHWDEPDGDVRGIQIFRDGLYLAEVPPTQLSYADSDAYKYFADSIVQYSYAYVNTGGAGSTQMAVNKEYYDALKAESGDLYDKLTALDKQSPDIFSDVMTYPRYPVALGSVVASTSSQPNTAYITVTMGRDRVTMGRYQRYALTLKAYTVTQRDAQGNPIAYRDDTVTAIDTWDRYNQYHNPGTKVQNPNYTSITQSGGITGARTTWNRLSNAFVYQICLEEVYSNGTTGGQTVGEGMEGLLGKEYFVNATSFGYKYNNDTTSPALKTFTDTWANVEQTRSGALADYTGNKAWDTPLNDGYITFNMSPEATVAGQDHIYDGNDNVRTASDGTKYVLVDQNSTEVSINVAVWDEDGTGGKSSPYVRGFITLANGSTVNGSAEYNKEFQRNKADAMEIANLYTMKFTVTGLPNGIYEDLTVRTSDGVTESTSDVKIMLVVNRKTPSSTVTGGVKREIEYEKTYTDSELVPVTTFITRTPTTDQRTQPTLARVALTVMPDAYVARYGTNDYTILYNYLVNGTGNAALKSDALAQAKALLGSNTGTDYVQGNGYLTEAGLRVALLSEAPPVTKYTKVDQTVYNTAVTNGAPADKLSVDQAKTEGVEDTYWIELSYAVQNNYCDWLEKNGSSYKVKLQPSGVASADTRTMKLVTSFGGNISSQSVDFTVKNRPSAAIQTEKHFGWVTVGKQEFDTVSGSNTTIGETLTKYWDCFDNEEPNYSKIVETVNGVLPDRSTTTAAYQQVGNDYQVYKLEDYKGVVDVSSISAILKIDLGTYDQFNEAGVAVVERGTTPSGPPSNYFHGAVQIAEGNDVRSIIKKEDEKRTNEYTVRIGGLTPDQSYFLWSYFILPDGSVTYSADYVAMTTKNTYKTTFYGFHNLTVSYDEMDFSLASNRSVRVDLVLNADRSQTNPYASAQLKVVPEYLQADEYGTLLTDDESGQPLSITDPDKLRIAKESIHLGTNARMSLATDDDGNEYGVLNLKDVTDSIVTFPVTIRNTNEAQGHMVMRLHLVKDHDWDGFCSVTNGASYIDVFLLDANSPVTTYQLGVVNEADGSVNHLTQNRDGTYSYEFNGLPLDYSEFNTLTVTFNNAGTGDLQNIEALIYNDNAGKLGTLATSNAKFEAETPSTINLLTSVKGAEGTIQVHPSSGLGDGTHYSWLVLRADSMKEADYIRIRLRQVVGQTTLSGRILLTSEREFGDNEYTGKSTIKLYNINNVQWYANNTLRNRGDPVYTMTTNDSGWYTIPNIVNTELNTNTGREVKVRYEIMVERDGFLIYDSITGNRDVPMIETDGETKNLTFNLTLLGGDANMDGEVNSKDVTVLLTYFNEEVASYEKALEQAQKDLAAAQTDEAVAAATQKLADAEKALVEIRRCDYNGDGVVNALDRAYVQYNQNKKGYDATLYEPLS